MSSLVGSCIGWLDRNLAWPHSRQSWQERLTGLAWLASTGLVCWFHDRLSPVVEIILWSLLVLALTVLLRRGLVKLSGPVFFYDLIRTARRGRHIFIRVVYALGLFLVVYVVYVAQLSHGTLQPKKLTAAAEVFFTIFMVAQFAVVFLLTPVYTAGAITEEKERRTLEFLLATDLRNHEIVLGKLASRVGNLLLVILAGLPVMALLLFMGGIDPQLVLAGFMVTGISMVSLASLSIFFSVQARRTRDAMIQTYLTMIVYGIVSYLVLFFPAMPIPSWLWPFQTTASVKVTGDLQTDLDKAGVPDKVLWQIFLLRGRQFATPQQFSLEVTKYWTRQEKDLYQPTIERIAGDHSRTIQGIAASGNLIAGIMELGDVWGDKQQDQILFRLVRNYTVFHALLSLGLTGFAIRRIRAVALRQPLRKLPRGRTQARVSHRRPVGSWPMIWKEIHVGEGLRFRWRGKIVLTLIMLATLAPGVIAFLYGMLQIHDNRKPAYIWRQVGDDINKYLVRGGGTILACAMLLAVAVRAASSISSERERQTYEGLLTTPMDSDTILFGKWLGSILCVRWAWIWLGSIWVIGLVSTGLHPLAVPFLVVAWLVYAAFLAGLGCWFSIGNRSSLRATTFTLLVAVGLTGGHLLATQLLIPDHHRKSLEVLFDFQVLGLTPPVTLAVLAFDARDYSQLGNSMQVLSVLVYAIMGLGIWSIAAAIVWVLASNRFRRATRRTRQCQPKQLQASRLAGTSQPAALDPKDQQTAHERVP